MLGDDALFQRWGGFSARQVVIALIAVSVLSRFYLCAQLPLLPDEAYYYLWSQHLDASYFSKGPAIAYTIAAGTSLFGHNAFGVRFFSVLLSAGTAWQLFLLARRWFDENTGLLAVLLASIVPIYAAGAIIMTIDPLSAFFWLWGANFFSHAMETSRLESWFWAGFAVGCGFLAKFLNGLELLAFLLFLLVTPAQRSQLFRPGFWLMLAVAIFCTLPIWWWNVEHHWPTWQHLIHRGDLNHGFALNYHSFWNFLVLQMGVISPVLFLILLGLAGSCLLNLFRGRAHASEIYLLLLFLVIFLFYAVLAWHAPEEPNWPVISYFSLLILLANRATHWLQSKAGRIGLSVLFLTGWLEIILLNSTAFLPLSGRMDPISRVKGWQEIAVHLQQVRTDQHAEVLITDAYKEASILSFYLPNHAFIYTNKDDKPGNEFYFWPSYATNQTAIYLTYNHDASAVAGQFNHIVPIDRIMIFYRGNKLRDYTLYRCENR